MNNRRQINLPPSFRFIGNRRSQADRRKRRPMRWLWMPMGRLIEIILNP